MEVRFKKYIPENDFLRIRDFLVDTFSLYGRPFNWMLDRWNFVRYFVVPIHTYHNNRYFGVPTNLCHNNRDELPLWEDTIGIWEDNDDIVGVVHSENEEPGEAWIQIHPDYTFLYDDMVTYIEKHLSDKVGNIGYVKLYIYDHNEQLKNIALDRGYRRLVSGTSVLEYVIDDLPEVKLPKDFKIKSVLDEDDVEKRRRVKSIAFGSHYNPSAWSPASAFKKMQEAPDYRKDLDLFVVAPNCEYVSFCTVWIDEKNKYGNFEPVGTHTEYQRMGLARAVMLEGFKRMTQYGVTRSFMDSNNRFYQKIGFKKTPYSYYPWIKYFTI